MSSLLAGLDTWRLLIDEEKGRGKRDLTEKRHLHASRSTAVCMKGHGCMHLLLNMCVCVCSCVYTHLQARSLESAAVWCGVYTGGWKRGVEVEEGG